MAITINGSTGITSSEIADGTITTDDISSSAGIINNAGTCAFSSRSNSSAWSSKGSGEMLPFDNVSLGDSFDTDSCYDTSTYKFTAPETGVYMFWYSIYSGMNDTSNSFYFKKNSAAVDFQYNTQDYMTVHNDAVDAIQSATIIIPLNINDTMAAASATTADFFSGHSQWGGCRLK